MGIQHLPAATSLNIRVKTNAPCVRLAESARILIVSGRKILLPGQAESFPVGPQSFPEEQSLSPEGHQSFSEDPNLLSEAAELRPEGDESLAAGAKFTPEGAISFPEAAQLPSGRALQPRQ